MAVPERLRVVVMEADQVIAPDFAITLAVLEAVLLVVAVELEWVVLAALGAVLGTKIITR